MYRAIPVTDFSGQGLIRYGSVGFFSKQAEADSEEADSEEADSEEADSEEAASWEAGWL